MPTNFPTIADSQIQVGTVIDEDVFTELHDRDKSLVECPFFYKLDEWNTNSATFVTVGAGTQRIYIPAGAKQLKIALRLKRTGGTSAEARVELDGGTTVSSEATTTDTAYPSGGTENVVCSFTDVSVHRGSVVDIEVQIKGTGGATATVTHTPGLPCYFLGA